MHKANPVFPSASTRRTVTLGDVGLQVMERGKGRPVLFLHPHIGLKGSDAALAGIAGFGHVLVPSHPGFEGTARPGWVTGIDDIALLYLDLLDALRLRDVVVVGVGLGGWIAAEMAVCSCERIGALVLAGAVGIRVGSQDEPDLADIFALPQAEIDRLAFADPARAAFDPAALSEEEAHIMASNREAAARYGWQPYMHDPKLRRRLARVRAPALVLWGDRDRIAPEAYGRAYAAALAGARFELVPDAGHFIHIEQPQAFAGHVAAFAGDPAAAKIGGSF